MTSLLFRFLLVIILSNTFNFCNAQGQKDETHICNGLHNEDSSFNNKSLVNGFVTGWTNPYVIDLATSTPYHMIFVSDFTDVNEIIINHPFISNHTLNGSPITTLSLLDDGLGNDEVAGDNIFTSSDIVFNDPFNLQVPTGSFMRFADVTYNYNNGTTDTYNIDLGFGVRMLRSDVVDINIPIQNVNSGIQYSSHVFNIATDLVGQSALGNLAPHTHTFYNHFPDEFDFLMFATSYATPGGPAGSYARIHVDYTGVVHNQNTFDFSSSFGSNGELNGIIRYFYTFGGAASLTNHEILHHYGISLHPSLPLHRSGHWNVVEFPSSGFASGLQSTDIIDLGGNCYDTERINYTIAFNDLEKYLMGLAPLSDVNWPLRTLVNWTFNGFSNPCLYTSTTGIVETTQADFQALMPPRVPDHTTSQKDFKSAMIVLTDRLMTPMEMAYYNWQMEQNEMLIGDPDRNTAWSSLNFNEATSGLATLTTLIEDICDIQINNYIGTSDDWFDPSNWSLGIVPTNCHRVIIPNGKIVRILQGQSGVCYTVEVEDGATLDVNNGALFQAEASGN
jgi:hypothetical protein